VIEHFGGSEVFALKMTMEWVGTSADFDIPLTRNVRRYYIGSTTHGGGGGGFVHQPPATGANCPGNNWGTGTFRANPMPSTQMINVIRLAMRAWLMNGTPPPPSRYPTLIGGTLVSPTRQDMGFPAGVPGVPESVFEPENFIFPVFDYDWGPDFNRADGSGVPTNLPPPINKVIPMKVPRVDADGNELGGVPVVLRDVPLDADKSAIRKWTEMNARILGAPTEEIESAIERVQTALRHPLLDRARASKRKHREYPVMLRVTMEGDGNRLMEGIIDLAFVEDDAWVVVDFKTDADVSAKGDLYQRQLQWYASALSRLTGLSARAYLLSV